MEELCKEWYVIHTYAGYENKVKDSLERRTESMDMQDYIFRVIVPMEDEVQVKDGKRKVVQRKVFPGYVLVEMVMTDESWYIVRNTTGVTGFVGMGNKPVPLSPEEADVILAQMGVIEGRRLKVDFEAGDMVRLTKEPFENYTGIVEDVFPEKGTIRVLVDMFGRETPFEVEVSGAERM